MGGLGRPVPMRNKDIYGKGTVRFKRVIQNTDLYRNLRSFCLMRAKYKCEECGKGVGEIGVDGKLIKQLDLHHKVEFDLLLEQYKITNVQQARMCAALWDVNNGQIRCSYHHSLTDSYGKGKNH